MSYIGFDEVQSRFAKAREEARIQLKAVTEIETAAEVRLLESRREHVIEAIDRAINEVRVKADQLGMSYVLVSRVGNQYSLVPMLQPMFQTSLGGNQQTSIALPTLLSTVDQLKTRLREGRMDEQLRLPVMRLIVEQALKVGLTHPEK